MEKCQASANQNIAVQLLGPGIISALSVCWDWHSSVQEWTDPWVVLYQKEAAVSSFCALPP